MSPTPNGLLASLCHALRDQGGGIMILTAVTLPVMATIVGCAADVAAVDAVSQTAA